MKKLPAVLVILVCAASFFPVYAEEATAVAENVLQITLSPVVFGFANQTWDDKANREEFEGGGIKFYNLGMGVEYGISDWLSSEIRWVPGANAWSDGPDDAVIGPFFDLTLASKAQIIGPRAPVAREDMRLTTALEVKAPLPSGNDTDLELDSHLWGLGLKGSYDYIFVPFFFLNGTLEVFYYPEQRLKNPSFGGDGKVNHPVDIALEIEPRFHISLKEGAVVLKTGLPLTYKVGPATKFNGYSLGDTHNFTISPNFSALFPKMALPFEFALRYDVPVVGKNEAAINRVTLLAKLMPSLSKSVNR
jgi:hypothetical protein